MFKVVLIKGDGKGPEIADSVVEIFDAVKVLITRIEKQAGLSGIEKRLIEIPSIKMETEL